MPCEIKIQISNYNPETEKVEAAMPLLIGTIDNDQELSLDQIADFVVNLDKDTRNALADLLQAAEAQEVTKKMLEQHQLVSNITLEGLLSIYPDLAKYNIPADLRYSFNIIRCHKAEFGGTSYKGRVEDSKGNEYFFINNFYDAQRLFKHLSAKLNLVKYIQGNNIDESLSEFSDDLHLLAKHYKMSVQKVIEDFLIHKNEYRPFVVDGKTYNPIKIINTVLGVITGELYDSGDKSDLHMALESVKEKHTSTFEWKFSKRKLYDVISSLNEDFKKSITYENFCELGTDALNELLAPIFSEDMKLMKATVKSVTHGSSKAHVIIDLHNGMSIGDIYNFGYSDQPLFTPTETYKGFYIYEYHSKGQTHYAISRSIISPKSFMKTFSNLESARAFIDNNNDTIKSCGLWSIKQHSGIPRRSEIEMAHMREGQIITTLDLELPSYKYEYFSGVVRNIMDGTVPEFHEAFSFVPNITTLDTPEKAAAFIFLTHKLIDPKYNKEVKEGENLEETTSKKKIKKDYFETIREKEVEVQDIIRQINSAGTISYLVEKKESIKGINHYYLKLLKNNGTNISLEGTFGDITVQDFVDQNLEQAINYFSSTFGIPIHAVTRSELELMSQEQKLGMEKKLDVVKAFVYNGEIYINTSNANMQDLFHEISHIFLGVIKATDPQAYEEIVKSFMARGDFKYLFKSHKITYEHYSEQDVIEETIADMIAEEMFKAKQLGTSDFVGDEFMRKFEVIMKKSQKFTNSIPDNGIGFSKYISDLLNENGSKVQRNMRISELIRKSISDGKILEDCEV